MVTYLFMKHIIEKPIQIKVAYKNEKDWNELLVSGT